MGLLFTLHKENKLKIYLVLCFDFHVFPQPLFLSFLLPSTFAMPRASTDASLERKEDCVPSLLPFLPSLLFALHFLLLICLPLTPTPGSSQCSAISRFSALPSLFLFLFFLHCSQFSERYSKLIADKFPRNHKTNCLETFL